MQIGNKNYEGLYVTQEYGSIINDTYAQQVKELIKKKGKIIDIGANLGINSILFAQEIPHTEFLCFEPTRHISEMASKNLQVADIPHKMYNVALSNFNGTSGFNFSDSHQTNKINAEATNYIVDVHTLDYYNIDDVSLIKIDVEGHEVQVLEGASNTIKKNKPVILLEYHKEADSNNLFFTINNLGYDCIFFENGGVFIPNTINQIILIDRDGQ